MLPHEPKWILPIPPSQTTEVMGAYQVTYEFYQEIRYRETHKRYCQWYKATAEQHRRELQKMRGDINILGWFCRGFKSMNPN